MPPTALKSIKKTIRPFTSVFIRPENHGLFEPNHHTHTIRSIIQGKIITKIRVVTMLKPKWLTATCFFMEDHEAKETNKAVVEEPMYAPINVAAAPSNGKIFSNKAVITIMVIAELDWVMIVPISPISINHHQWKSVYCDKSILALKNFILSFIYSNHKNTNHKAISIKNHLRYFLEKNAPSQPIATMGIIIGSMSNHKPNKPMRASIKTDPTFIPITITIAWFNAIIPPHTRAKIIRETAWLDWRIFTSQAHKKNDFSFVFVIDSIHFSSFGHQVLATSSITSKA